ncbi:MAG TPA: uracil-DNA glycosylase [Candidatus Polarisedimenticolia bacterium]
MSGRDERRELLDQARQYLLFCREMGVTELDLSGAGAPVRGAARAPQQAVPPPDLFSEPPPRAAAIDPQAELEDLRVNVIGECRRCKLCEGRTHIVFGDGSAGARLMFVGEGPGSEEDRRGLPFVGRAGQLLDQIIKAMGYSRSEVYIANVVKCRPPDNRTPQPDETASCTPFLFRQIEIIQPKVIVALGSPASQALLETSAGITKIRGTFRQYRGIPVMPTFHPAYLLRNPAAKREVWDDMRKVMALLQTQ